MNVRQHLAGFAIFSVILGSAIFINHYLNIPTATIPPVPLAEAPSGRVKEHEPPVSFRVRQVSLDYNQLKSYTELRLFRRLDRPVPERVWVLTTFFSPDSVHAESWTTVEEIKQPFTSANGEAFVVISSRGLPPSPATPGAGYFARVEVSSQSEGTFYQPSHQINSDFTHAVPVVVHWPDQQGAPARMAKARAR
jgi:hypothetical protein